MWAYKQTDELYHYGVLGMKWGKRKGSSRSLSENKKKRLSKKYEKSMNKARADLAKTNDKRYADAWNSEAEIYNKQNIKSGSKEERQALKQVGKKINSRFNKMTLSELENNPNYKKGKAICEKYNLTSYDSLAKETEEFVNYLRKD